MEQQSDKKLTTKFLEELGFVQVGETDFYDSPYRDWAGRVVQVYVYCSMSGRHCVSVDGGYRAPAADVDPDDNLESNQQFVKYLNKYFPGWG
mgnify:FL=1